VPDQNRILPLTSPQQHPLNVELIPLALLVLEHASIQRTCTAAAAAAAAAAAGTVASKSTATVLIWHEPT
jgi:hypothetical protein